MTVLPASSNQWVPNKPCLTLKATKAVTLGPFNSLTVIFRLELFVCSTG